MSESLTDLKSIPPQTILTTIDTHHVEEQTTQQDDSFVEGTPQCLSIHEQECVQTLEGASGHLKGSLELGDGRLVSWSGQSVQLWDLHDGSLLFQQSLSCWSIAGVKSLPDGRLAVWHTLTGDIHLWDPNTQVIGSFTAHEHTVYDVVVYSDDTLLSCSLDGTARIWDYPSLRLRHTIVLAKDPIKQITPLDAQQIMLANPPFGDTVLVWDIATHQNVWEITANQAWQHPDNLLLTEHFGLFSVWSPTKELLAEWAHEPGFSHHAQFLPNQQVLLSQSNSTNFTIIDLLSGKIHLSWQAHKECVQSMKPIGQGCWLSYARESIMADESDNTLVLWNDDAWSVSWEASWRCDVGAPISQVICLSDARLLVLRQHKELGQTMLILDRDTGRQTHLLSGHTSPINGACQLSDGRLLSWSQDMTLRVWEL